jgi:very-short-patch-repair endonuclease
MAGREAIRTPEELPAMLRTHRLRRVGQLAEQQGGVVSRRQLYVAQITRGEVRAHVRARRWQRIGSQCLALHTGPLALAGQHWAAVLEAGPRAHLDGASALIASGLRNYNEAAIRVSVPKGARVRRAKGLDIRETRRWRADDIVRTGVPRSKPAVAAIRGALWAVTDRQASLILTMTVQQGLCRAEELVVQLLRVRRDKRRVLIQGVLTDLVGGVGSLAELDVLRGCRERKLPEPDTQAIRRTSRGTVYLDFRWSRWGVVLEVDGIHHEWATQIIGDALRHNEVAMSGDVVLRLPVLGLRVCPDEFFAQVEDALRRQGCPLPAIAS